MSAKRHLTFDQSARIEKAFRSLTMTRDVKLRKRAMRGPEPLEAMKFSRTRIPVVVERTVFPVEESRHDTGEA